MFRKSYIVCGIAWLGIVPSLNGADPKTGILPNIIYIMADDLGPHDVGCYGQQLIKTPHIDRLASQGTRFTQVCAGASVCAPSRCVLMTGLHTGHARVRANNSKIGGVIGENGDKGRVPLKPEDVTLAEVLKTAGYTTGITGKWGLGEWNTLGIPNLQGFDHWFGYLNQQTAHSYYPDFLWLNQQKFDLPGNQHRRRQQYALDLFTGFATNFIRSQAGKPFFLYLAYTTPHAKFEAPDLGPYADQNWREGAREYAAMVTRMDEQIGQVLGLLDELKLSDNTIVFFCSDNGGPAPFGDVFKTNGSLRAKKGQVYEGGLRIPMIVRWPGHVPTASDSDQPWYFADVLPTLAEVTGAKAPEKLDGLSILPTLLGKKQDLSNRFQYWEQFSHGFEQAVRTGNWKAVRHGLNQPLELYDLKSDPSEVNNIASAHPQVVVRIEGYLKTAHTDSADYRIEESQEAASN